MVTRRTPTRGLIFQSICPIYRTEFFWNIKILATKKIDLIKNECLRKDIEDTPDSPLHENGYVVKYDSDRFNRYRVPILPERFDESRNEIYFFFNLTFLVFRALHEWKLTNLSNFLLI